MNTYGLLGGLLLMAGLGSWAVWERGTAEHWHSQYVSLQASYSQAADKAKADAEKKEAQDLDALAKQSSSAIALSQSKAVESQRQLAEYQKKIKEASGMKDLPHLCAGVPVPPDLIPAP